MVPVMLVVTTLAAIVTIIGSALGGARWWGYYPQIIWARLFCWLNFVTVSVTGHENIRKTHPTSSSPTTREPSTYSPSTDGSATTSAG